jgi:hypothetical protein
MAIFNTRMRMEIHWSAMELAHDHERAEANVAAIESEAVGDESTLNFNRFRELLPWLCLPIDA